MPFDGNPGTVRRVARVPKMSTLAKEPHAGVHFNQREDLGAAVVELCAHRLRETAGLELAAIKSRLVSLYRRHSSARATESAGPKAAGRPKDVRARFVHELEHKDLFQTRHAPAPADLAILWLLAVGEAKPVEAVAHLSAAKLKSGVSAASVIDDETATMKKHLQRYGAGVFKGRDGKMHVTMIPVAPGEVAKQIVVGADGRTLGMRPIKSKRRGLARR
ncbi:MAG TPA: hypothetical protein VIK01_15695 [Polyangiaceae bacterium]